MIVDLTKEDILILSFALGLYQAEMEDTSQVHMKMSKRDCNKIMEKFNKACGLGG